MGRFMAMKRSVNVKFSEMRVGIIVGVSFLLGILAIVTYGKVHEIFSKQVHLTVLFKDVRGLTVGAPVRLAGITSGFVKEIHLVQIKGERFVQVGLRLDATRLPDLSEEATARIETQGLMGIKFVELIPGDLAKGPLNPSIPIMGSGTQTLESVLGKGNHLVKSLNALSFELNRLIGGLNSGEGTIGSLVTSKSLYQDLDASAKNLNAITQTMRSGSGTIPQLMNSPEMARKLSRSIDHLDQLLQAANDPKGTFGELSHDPDMAKSLAQSLSSLNTLLRNLANGKGVAGELLNNEQMTEKVNSTLDRVNDLLKDMKDHPHRYFTVEVHVF
jgi:phospholipid/cholesterol/gamma-HCH transport system substrate-binding protein